MFLVQYKFGLFFMKYKPPKLKNCNDHIALIKTLRQIVVYTLWLICIKYCPD